MEQQRGLRRVQHPPDALDKLLNLKAFTKTYSHQQIDQARSLIGQQQDAQKKGDLFEILQSKVPYHNQRNNQSLGLSTDKWINKRTGKEINFVEKPIGDIMCNLTSLAMVLETLGIESPKQNMQYEDHLEQIRRDKKFAARITASGWGATAKALGAKKVKHFSSFKGGYEVWRTKVLPHLRSGHGVMMSLGGHIVRLQSITPKGIIVDDPFGKLPSLLNYSSGAVTKSYAGQLNNKKTESGVGEDNLYPWKHVEKHEFRWIAAFSKE